MFILDLTFISFQQSVLLWVVTTPAYILLNVSRLEPQLTLADFIFASIILGLLAIETIADQQQWNFHQAKAAYLKHARVPAEYPFAAQDLDRGFLTHGLWSWSRHPNLAAEQAIWVTFYQWAAYSSRSYPLNFAVFGVIAYLLIFALSTPLTEAISSSKYPEYKEYQRLVGRFLPGVPGTGGWGVEGPLQRWFEKQVRLAQEDEKREKRKSVENRKSK